MKNTFIYVFDKESRDKMISLGYEMIKENPRDSIYVFENKNTFVFEKNEIQFVLSDTITF